MRNMRFNPLKGLFEIAIILVEANKSYRVLFQSLKGII